MELTAFQKKIPIREYEAFKPIVSCFMKKINGLDNAPEIYLTTHSPIVISSCQNEHLILLTDDKEVVYFEDFSEDLQDTLKHFTGR